MEPNAYEWLTNKCSEVVP